jgi:hypothetical protein
VAAAVRGVMQVLVALPDRDVDQNALVIEDVLTRQMTEPHMMPPDETGRMVGKHVDDRDVDLSELASCSDHRTQLRSFSLRLSKVCPELVEGRFDKLSAQTDRACCSAMPLARPGRQRLCAGSPVEDAGSLHEVLSTDISLGEALSEDPLGVLFR